MINNELLGYIKEQLAIKVSREDITTNLKSAGWTDVDVSEAFTAITLTSLPSSVPISPAAPVVTPNLIQPQTVFPKTTETVTGQPINSVSSAVESKSKSKNKKIFSIILILVLLGLAGGAYAYYSGFFVSLPVLTSQAIDSARAAKSASYDNTITVDFSELTDTSSLSFLSVNAKQLSITGKGSYDASDSKNFKSSFVISANLGSFSLAAEIRTLDNTFYGVLTKAPILGFFPMLASYENKWFSFPYKSEDGQITSNPLTTLSPVNPNIISKLTADQKEHIYKISRDAHFVKTAQKLSLETVGGELSYHFLFDLDREGISSYLQSLKDYVNAVGKDDSALSSFDPTSSTKELDKIKDFKGEIWIGRGDKLLHKIVLNFGIEPDVTKAEQVKINIVSIFSGWNQPVSIVAPSDSVPFETLMSSVMANSLNTQGETGVPAAKYDAFAQCIKASGATLYGAFWAPHVQAQKKLFGSSEQYLPYVECSTQDANNRTQICIDKNITAYPTWILKNGTRLKVENSSGVTLKTLAAKTGCSLPK